MADYRIVKTKFWDDPYIATLDTRQKLLFLYLLTNSCTDISGAYEISLRKIEFDTGIEADWVQSEISRFEADRRMFYKDGWIFIPNFIKNQSLNPSVIKGIVKSLENVPVWIKDMADWSRLGIASPQAVGKIDSKERKESKALDKLKQDLINQKIIK